MWLLHGTTRNRADSILMTGPDIDFVEPGGGSVTAENFSFTLGDSATSLGEAATYARDKAKNNPSEGGPAVVAVDAPDDIVRAATVEHLEAYKVYGLVIEYDEGASVTELVALTGGYVQFDRGPALTQLLAVWGALTKEIRGVS